LIFLIAVGLLIRAWKQGAHTAPLSPIGAGVALVVALPVTLLLIWIVILHTLLW
jgi:hypothetical protein